MGDDDRINDDAQSTAREGLWVSANKDFRYDADIGEVKLGQAFQLGGHVNDAGLIRHSLVAVIDPQPTVAQKKKFPTCGECGRKFVMLWHRDRCGRSHGDSDADTAGDRRARVHNRVLDASASRMVTVGM